MPGRTVRRVGLGGFIGVVWGCCGGGAGGGKLGGGLGGGGCFFRGGGVLRACQVYRARVEWGCHGQTFR